MNLKLQKVLEKSKGTGKISDEQLKVLKALSEQKWDVLISNDLFEITEKICKHMNQYQLPPKRQKKTKQIKTNNKSILDFFDDENDRSYEHGRIT